MNPKTDIVFKFIKQLLQLRELVKCPICLEGIQDCVELDCGHKLCGLCFDGYVLNSKPISCPICVNKVARRSPVYKNSLTDLIGSYVNKAITNLENTLKCKIQNLKTEEDVSNFLNKIKSIEIPLITNMGNKTPKVQNTSNKDNSLTIEKEKKTTTQQKAIKRNIMNITNAENAFNKLINSGNRKRTYTKKKNETIVADKVLEFEDSDNKIKVLQWLTNSKNKFDILTCTQADRTSQISYSDAFDLPSVSQKTFPKCPSLLTSKHFEVISNRRQLKERKCKVRARSLDITVKKQPEKKYLKRHSLACDTPDLEKYVIEDINTEEDNPELKQKISSLEEQILNSIDQEMLSDKNHPKPTAKVKQHKSSKSEKKPSPSGWERMKKMSRTLKKTEKTPKQLNITTLQSTQLAKEITPLVKKIDKVAQESKNKSSPSSNEETIEEQLKNKNDAPKETGTNSEKNSVSKNKVLTVNLKSIESFFCQKMVEINCNSLNDSENCSLNQNDSLMKLDLQSSNNKIQSYNCLAKSDSKNHISKETNKIIMDVDLDEDEMEVFSKSTQKLIFEEDRVEFEKEMEIIEDGGDVFFQPTQKLLLNEDSNETLEKGLHILTDYEKKFKKFKKVLLTVPNVTPCLKERLSELELYTHQFRNCLKGAIEEKANNSDNKNFQAISDCMFTAVNTTTQTVEVEKVDKLVQTDILTPQKGFQLSTNDLHFATQNFSQKSIQTDGINCLSCKCFINFGKDNLSMQGNTKKGTEKKKDSDLIDFLDDIDFHASHINEANSSEKHTSSIENKKSSQNLKKCAVKQQIQKNGGKSQKTQNFGTELEFDYDTQDLIKQNDMKRNFKSYSSKSSITQNIHNSNTQKNENLSQKKPSNPPCHSNTGSSQESELLCTVDSNISKVNRKLDFVEETKKFKRIRVNETDSDSDNEPCIKKHCTETLGVNEDLLIENSQKRNDKENAVSNTKKDDSFQLSQGSDDVNYDEYLAQVMKKYSPGNEIESPKVKATSPKKLSEEKAPEDKTCADLILECDDIIKNTRNYFNENQSAVNDISNKEQMPKSLSSSISDIIADTEPLLLTQKQNKKKKVIKFVSDEVNVSGSLFENSESFFKNLKNQQKLKTQKNEQANQPENDIDILEEINIAQEQFQMDVDFDDIDEPDKNNKTSEKICIIGNVLLNTNVDVKELNDKKTIKDSVENEIFISDIEDADVIETTPQKYIEKSFRSMSESSQKHNTNIIEEEDFGIEPLDFDIAVPPPPEFQDDGYDKENTQNSAIEKQISEISHKESKNVEKTLKDFVNTENKVEPELIVTPNRVHRSLNRSILSTRKPCTSTQNSEPISQNILNLSPIPLVGKKFNFIEAAKQSKFCPLTITIKPSPKKPHVTSTPRQKSILNYMTTSQETKSQQSISNMEKKKPCIACTRLNKDQVIAISSLTNKKLATYSNSFSRQVTHMIVSVDEKNCIKDHTIKFVSAISAGIWVLNFGWIQDCLASNCIVPEEPYEALDTSGIPGPKKSRLTRLTNPLFKGYKIHAAAPFLSTTKQDVEEVLTLLGGKVVENLQDISKKDGYISLIIAEARATQDFEMYETWLEALRVVTVDIEWLSRSIGQYKLLSLRPFTLCSDDSICDLGYPEDLLISVPFSFSQNTYSSSSK